RSRGRDPARQERRPRTTAAGGGVLRPRSRRLDARLRDQRVREVHGAAHGGDRLVIGPPARREVRRDWSAAGRRAENVEVYGLDFGSGSLKSLEILPHVGSIIPGDDPERLQRILRSLAKVLDDRGKRF